MPLPSSFRRTLNQESYGPSGTMFPTGELLGPNQHTASTSGTGSLTPQEFSRPPETVLSAGSGQCVIGTSGTGPLAAALLEAENIWMGETSGLVNVGPASTDVSQTSSYGEAMERRAAPPIHVLKQWYERVARPYVDLRAREEVLAKWSLSGPQGASWVISRLLEEHQFDALETAGNVLSTIGEAAVPFVIGALRLVAAEGEDAQVAVVLLHTLRNFGKSNLSGWVELIPSLAKPFGLAQDRDVREAAYRTAEILPKEEAVDLTEFRSAA